MAASAALRRAGLIAALLAAGAALAQPPAATVVQTEEGKFSLRVPAGWALNTASGEKFASDALLYRASRMKQVPDGVVRIRLQEHGRKALERQFSDYVNAYQAEYAPARAQPFAAGHPRYRTVSRVLANPGVRYEYTAFVETGRDRPVWVVGMTKLGGAPADENEIAAFRAVVASLQLLEAGDEKKDSRD